MKALCGSLTRIGAGFFIWFYVFISAAMPALLLPQATFAQTKAAVAKPTCKIVVNPTSIPVGGSVTVKWTSTNATAGAITNIGNVSPSGSINLLPSSAGATYYGAFTGPGGTANCQASVAVTISSGGSSGGSSSSGNTTSVVGDTTGVTTPAPSSDTASQNSQISGLVPCGYGAFDPNNTQQSATGCQACNLVQLIQNIINFLIGIAIPIAAALFAYAGWLYFTSAANPANIGKAKSIFKSAFLGFLLAVSAWLIVNTILHVIFNQGEFANGNWFTIQCVNGESRQTNGKIGTLLQQIPILNGGAPITGSGNIYTGGSPSGGGGGGYGGASTVDSIETALISTCANYDQASCDALDAISSNNNQLTGSAGDAAMEALNAGCDGGNQQSCNALMLMTGNPDATGKVKNPQMAAQLASACAQYNLSDCTFAESIAGNESSGGSNCSTSPTGAAGCMQVLARTACSMDPTIDNCLACTASGNSTSAACAPVINAIKEDPQLGVNLGVRYIAQLQNMPALQSLQQQYGTCQITAAAYFQGPGAVLKSGGVPSNAVSYVNHACR